jgi:molecular chaperone GrpE
VAENAAAQRANAESAAGDEADRDEPGPQLLAERVAQLEDGLARARADYSNLQRRISSERADAVLFANADLMKSLVAVLDDLDRALAAADDSDNLQAVVDGVRIVQDNFHKALAGAGLEIIDPQGRPFDPSIHEALMRRPTDGHPPGTVIEVVGKGYKLRDRVIRPARVIVAAPPDQA